MRSETSPQLPLVPSPEDLMLRRERLRRIERVFAEYLPEEQVVVMLAIYVEDLSAEETAVLLGLSTRDVNRRVKFALARLRTVPGLYELLRGNV